MFHNLKLLLAFLLAFCKNSFYFHFWFKLLFFFSIQCHSNFATLRLCFIYAYKLKVPTFKKFYLFMYLYSYLILLPSCSREKKLEIQDFDEILGQVYIWSKRSNIINKFTIKICKISIKHTMWNSKISPREEKWKMNKIMKQYITQCTSSIFKRKRNDQGKGWTHNNTYF